MELLVVIAIISVLVALLLPAVQSAREAARRAQCMNNLRQLGLAVNQYQTALTVFPASALYSDKYMQFGLINSREGTLFSWMTLVLPFLEEQAIHDRIDFDRTVFEQPTDILSSQPELLLCPSDGAESEIFQHEQLTENRPLGKGNYAAYVSPMHLGSQWIFSGALTATRGQQPRHVVDGLSRTVAISEVRVRPHRQDARGAWALGWNASSVLAFDMHAKPGTAKSGYSPSEVSLGFTQPPNNLGPNIDQLFDCPDPDQAQLQGMPCGTYAKSGEGRFLSSSPRSQHPGGVNIVFMDGHARFLTDGVDEWTMAYVICIDDGEIASLDD